MFMKKILLAFSIAALSFGAANAQDGGNEGFHIAGGLKGGFPTGTTGSSFNVGVELQGEYGFAENISGVISAGYQHFLAKTGFQSSGLIPVLAGIRFYPSTNVFISGKGGISFSTQTGGGSSFTYEPQVGYNAEKFQVYAYYQGYGQTGSVGNIGAAFLYKFN
jgi:hypothetical protein